MRLSDVSTAIGAAYLAQTCAYLWGPPGIGKTDIVKQCHADLLARIGADLRLITLRANLMEPVDFLGFQVLSADRTESHYAKPDFLPRPGTRGIVFLDELAQAPIATQCAAMRLVDELPDGWTAVAASNRVTDRAGAGTVATHVLNRFTHLDVEVSREDWQTWARDNGILPALRGFVDFRPHLLFCFDPARAQKDRAYASPRAWHKVSKLLQANPGLPPELLYPLVAGTVGDGAAGEFCGFLRVYQALPRIDDIISNPGGSTVPTSPDVLCAVCAALADRARTIQGAQLKALADYAVRLPTEYAALLLVDSIAVNPTLVTLPTVLKWTREHAEIIASPRN